MKELENLYRIEFGVNPENVRKLSGAGSSREYFRLSSSKGSVIGTYGREIAENEAFKSLSDYFSAKNVPVPKVRQMSSDKAFYIQDDLGDISLFDVITKQGIESASISELILLTLSQLAKAHAAYKGDFDLSKCYPRQSMDLRSVMWDLNYFKYCFLKPSGIDFEENLLQNEMERLAEVIANPKVTTLILRDFQSRNIMIHKGKPYFIDFQGARLGSPLYDLASFLWQARIDIPEDKKWHYAGQYIAQAHGYGLHFDESWTEELALYALFRMLQVLGAYGFRGLVEHKAQFITPIPVALSYALQLLENQDQVALPYLNQLFHRLNSLEKFKTHTSDGKLNVKVMSFSYKKGIPEDFTGNGGGFVFDCRALHNPGRYDQYKALTGRDASVIEFLESKSDIKKFLVSCYAIVDNAVDTYIQRGFTNLMVCFGCTGGRHRSLYSADHLARHIAETFDCHVRLIHREQNIDETLK